MDEIDAKIEEVVDGVSDAKPTAYGTVWVQCIFCRGRGLHIVSLTRVHKCVDCNGSGVVHLSRAMHWWQG